MQMKGNALSQKERKVKIAGIIENLNQLEKHGKNGEFQNYYLMNMNHPILNILTSQFAADNDDRQPLSDHNRFLVELSMLRDNVLEDIENIFNRKVDTIIPKKA